MIQLLIFNYPVFYRTEIMTISDVMKFLEKNKYPDFLYTFDLPKENYPEDNEFILHFRDDKEIDRDYFFTDENFTGNYNLDECYIDYNEEDIDVPFLDLFMDFDQKVWGLDFGIKIPYLETLEKCQNCDVVEMPIIELTKYLTDKINLQQKLFGELKVHSNKDTLEYNDEDIPCIIFYKNHLHPEINECMVLNRYSYLQNKFLTDPDSLVKVKKLFL